MHQDNNNAMINAKFVQNLPAVSMVESTHVACFKLADSCSKATIIELKNQWKLLFGLNCLLGTCI